ncbi:hypothetical protein NA78x_003272 [Anatilimnocola sp. NA78]|uniref:hypothetical protein n=1 Tax=Anatilimnocola sp. NA78 TaxID=3415683 RepID=UPI003CE5BA83
MQTPEFLCWAIERPCPLRELLPENQPDKVERHLRAARYVAAATAEHRIQDDIARSADGTQGFRVRDALVIYGGEDALRTCCESCPANAISTLQQPSYAGCFGMLPIPEPSAEFYAQLTDSPAGLFPQARINWYSWWITSPLRAPQIVFLARQFRLLSSRPQWLANQPLHEFTAALNACEQHQLSLSVQLYPAGEIDGPWWLLDPHCAVCRAPWQTEEGKCRMCGQSRHPAASKKRHVRGSRPYRPIEQIIP